MTEYAALIAKAEADLLRLKAEAQQSLAKIEAEQQRLEAQKTEILERFASRENDIQGTLRYIGAQQTREPKRHSYKNPEGKVLVDLREVPGRTMIEIVMRVLESDRSIAYSTPDVIRATGINNPKYIRTTLGRLYREGKIEKSARGFYQVKDTESVFKAYEMHGRRPKGSQINRATKPMVNGLVHGVNGVN